MPKYPNLPSVGKDVVFEGSSLADLKAFPDEPKRDVGVELDRLQRGLQPIDWRPMSTVGPGATAQSDIDLAAQRYRNLVRRIK